MNTIVELCLLSAASAAGMSAPVNPEAAGAALEPALSLPAKVALLASLVAGVVQALKRLAPRVFRGRMAVAAAAVLAFGGALGGADPAAADWSLVLEALLTALAASGLFSATKTLAGG